LPAIAVMWCMPFIVFSMICVCFMFSLVLFV
jgi:hypothetical protein